MPVTVSGPSGPVPMTSAAVKLFGSIGSENVTVRWSSAGTVPVIFCDTIFNGWSATANWVVKTSPGVSPLVPFWFWSIALPAKSKTLGPTDTVYDPSPDWKANPIRNCVEEIGVTGSGAIDPPGPVMAICDVVKLAGWIGLENVTSAKEMPALRVPVGEAATMRAVSYTHLT